MSGNIGDTRVVRNEYLLLHRFILVHCECFQFMTKSHVNKIMSTKFILFLTLINWTKTDISKVSDNLGLKNKFIINANNLLKRSTCFQMMKQSFLQNEIIAVNSNLDLLRNKNYTFSGILVSNKSFNFDGIKIRVGNPWIVISNETYYSQLAEPIYDYDNTRVWEYFVIKNIKVKNLIGTLINDEFTLNKDFNSNFFRRRGNFYGTKFKIMSERGTKKMEFIDNWMEIANKSEIIEGAYDVTGLLKGPIQDYLDVFARELNFTYKQFKREDNIVASYNKTTKEWTGMIRNLIDREVDFIASPFSYDFHRFSVADYLFPLLQQKFGFAIRSAAHDAMPLDWKPYINPFSNELWTLLIISVFTITLGIYLIFKLSIYYEITANNDFTFSYILWISFASFFGIIIENANGTNIGRSGRFVLFVLFLSGSILYYGYQAAVFSHLSVPLEILPFKNPSELARTNYFVLTSGSSVAQAQRFSQAEIGTDFHAVYQNNMNENSFTGTKEAMRRLLTTTEPYITVFGAGPSMVRYAEKHNKPCDIRYVWYSPVLDFMSFAFPKGSQLAPFFNEFYPHIREKGHFQYISQQFSKSQNTKCYNDPLTGIPFQKFISVLVLLALGIFSSLLLLICEHLYSKFYRFLYGDILLE